MGLPHFNWMLSVVTVLMGATCPVTPPVHAPPSIAGCPIFPGDNVWNTRVDNLPVHPDSAAWVGSIGATRNLHPDFGTFYLGLPIGISFVVVPPTQLRVPVTFDYADESDLGSYPIPPNPPIEGGPTATGDRHILMLESGTCVLHELFYAFPQTNGSWTAGSGARFDLRSHALRPAGWTSADAAGLPILPGLVRYDEVKSGEIRHAMRFTASQTQRAYLWPARHFASSLTDTQFPPMGARFRLKASVDTSDYAPDIQVILRALKQYGMILADNGSNWYISGEHHPQWSDSVLNTIKTIKGSDFEAVDTTRMVINVNSGQAAQ
jgi:hypothetical protein